MQDVASVDDQSRLVVPPDTVEVGDAEMKTWGADEEFPDATVTSAVAESLPPEPVQVIM